MYAQLVLLCRKIAFAVIAVMINKRVEMQAGLSVGIMCTAYIVHQRFTPYITFTAISESLGITKANLDQRLQQLSSSSTLARARGTSVETESVSHVRRRVKSHDLKSKKSESGRRMSLVSSLLATGKRQSVAVAVPAPVPATATRCMHAVCPGCGNAALAIRHPTQLHQTRATVSDAAALAVLCLTS